MNSRRPSDEGGEAGAERSSKSRFAYHSLEDELPLEGGVRSVGAPGSRGASSGVRGTGQGRSGAPGPEERLLDITEIVRHVGMHYRHVFRIPPFQEGDMDAAAPIEGAVTLTNTGAVLLVRGSAKTELRMECARCLATTVQPVETELEEEFDLVSSHDAFQQEEVHAVDADGAASVISGNVMNLADLLRQNLLLAAPVQPLCQDECPGIDPGEGATFLREEDALPPEAEAEEPADTPLRHLAEMLEAKRRQEESGAS
jgi:Predicted metal-binding, possibly nucleic acid-binding protein